MMTKIQIFMLGKEQTGGFVTAKEMPEIIALDPSVPLLIRCGYHRYLVPASLVEATLEAVRAGGDYVRDVSFSAQDMEEARNARALARKAAAGLVREVCNHVKVTGGAL